MAVIVDERLAIPLYHGTSDLFYGSIKTFGLGGRNLIKELRVIELLRQLVKASTPVYRRCGGDKGCF
jgi:hypothetical protein